MYFLPYLFASMVALMGALQSLTFSTILTVYLPTLNFINVPTLTFVHEIINGFTPSSSGLLTSTTDTSCSFSLPGLLALQPIVLPTPIFVESLDIVPTSIPLKASPIPTVSQPVSADPLVVVTRLQPFSPLLLLITVFCAILLNIWSIASQSGRYQVIPLGTPTFISFERSMGINSAPEGFWLGNNACADIESDMVVPITSEFARILAQASASRAADDMPADTIGETTETTDSWWHEKRQRSTVPREDAVHSDSRGAVVGVGNKPAAVAVTVKASEGAGSSVPRPKQKRQRYAKRQPYTEQELDRSVLGLRREFDLLELAQIRPAKSRRRGHKSPT